MNLFPPIAPSPHRPICSSVRVLAVCLAILAAPAALGQGYICAEGGGSIGSAEWTSPVFEWMVTKARGETPDAKVVVMILGSRDVGQALDPPTPPDPEDQTAQRFKQAAGAGGAEVRALWINSTNADKDEVYEAIRTSNIVWMRGGSQSRYVTFWKGTKTEKAIKEVFAGGGVVGGTSAGCAVLGEVIYDALNGSATSRDALRDPYNKDITLCTDFLGLTQGVLFDTHFSERARIARLAVMLGRCKQDLHKDVIGVGMDTRTAFCVSPDGTAEVIGQGAATVLRFTPETQIVLKAGQPPAVTNIEQTQLLRGDRYDTRGRKKLPNAPDPETGSKEPPLAKVEPWKPPPPMHQAIGDGVKLVLEGAAAEASALGDIKLGATTDSHAIYHGRMKLEPGDARVQRALIQTQSFDSAEFDENRVAGMIWGVAQRPGSFGLALTTGVAAEVSPNWTIQLAARPIEVARGIGFPADASPGLSSPGSSALLFEGAGHKTIRFGEYLISTESTSPRQVAGFDGGVLHVLAPGWGYDANARRIIAPTAPPKP